MTNDQAQGYVLLACKELGIGREQAEQLIYALESQFDYYAEREAREKGFDWLYDREKDPRFVPTNVRGLFINLPIFGNILVCRLNFAYNEFFFNSYLKITSINLDNGFFQPKLLFSDYDLKQKIVQSARN